MHIGLIGGIGVASTLAYYARLSAAVADRGATLDMTLVHADIGTLVKNMKAGDKAAQAEVYAPLLDRLKAAGCDCAAITSLGGHFCFEETLALSPLPLISALAPLDGFFQSEGLGCVGLLGTRVVMESHLYGQLDTTRAVVPDDMDAVSDAYFALAQSGKASEGDRAFFFAEGRKLIDENGADAVVLVGTDLGLAFDGCDPGYRVIDALDVHVEVLADLATGARALGDLAP